MSTSKSDRKAQAYAVLKSRRPSSAPLPQNVYGICLTEACLTRFGTMIRERMNPNFDQTDEIQVRVSKSFATARLPILCILGVPDLWLSRWTTPLVRSKAGIEHLLVFADDGSEEKMAMKNSKEVVKDLLSFLGMADQEPGWYPVVSMRAM